VVSSFISLIKLTWRQSKTAVLSNQGRPDQINRWICAGRKTWPPIEDISSFATAWKGWWILLQPSSRVKRRNNLVHTVDPNETWDGLKKGGINGFFNVVVSLGWWSEASMKPAQHKMFMEMVKDVLWVQEKIIATLDGPKKRTRIEEDTGAEQSDRKMKR
jgi:hypothetical protein